MNYLDIQEIIDSGILQEANRLFFHPRGLALEIAIDIEGDPYLSGIQDHRSDPEGVVFKTKPSKDKAIKVKDMYLKRAANRQSKLGWIIQPVEDH